jgi:hypothetical protein
MWVLTRLPQLKNFIFADTSKEFLSAELKCVSLCIKIIPDLETVGRPIDTFTEEEFKLADNVPNYYHDFLGLDCPVKTSALVPLKVTEIFTTESYLHTIENFEQLLPILQRLHIKNKTKNISCPKTVRELRLYSNANPKLLNAFSP